MKIQSMEGITKERQTANTNKKEHLKKGVIKGLDSNLRASAKGMNRPQREGLFGPRRFIMKLRTLRSSKV